MIELYDAARLSIRRDHTLVIAGSTLLVAAGLMGAYTVFLQLQLTSARQRTQTLQADLTGVDTAGRPAAKATPPSPRAALVVDLQRQAEQLEREAAAAGASAGPGTTDTTPTPAQWMDHLAALSQADTSLQKVDIERGGSARLEGLATSPQALNALVQAWQRQDGLAHLQPRSMDVKQEKLPAPFLRFQLRTTPTPPAPPTTPAATAAAPQP